MKTRNKIIKINVLNIVFNRNLIFLNYYYLIFLINFFFFFLKNNNF